MDGTNNYALFDSEKFSMPNQKVADFLRLLHFITVGHDQYMCDYEKCCQNACVCESMTDDCPLSCDDVVVETESDNDSDMVVYS